LTEYYPAERFLSSRAAFLTILYFCGLARGSTFWFDPAVWVGLIREIVNGRQASAFDRYSLDNPAGSTAVFGARRVLYLDDSIYSKAVSA
jgi:hypothetical protein